MMVMTAKVDFKKVILILAAAAVLILAAILIFSPDTETSATAAPSAASNDGRVQFLKDFGWEVTTSPVESSQVRIPEEMSDVYRRYNTLQQSQGYDLSSYGGKNVMRYVYQINNYPGATDPVYATLLVYKNKIIGGDITDTAAGGKIHSFQMPQAGVTQPTQPSTAATQPSSEAAA